MKIKTLVALQSIIEGRSIPSDMEQENYYYSESREEFLDIMEMDLHHFIRAFVKLTQFEVETAMLKKDDEIYIKEDFAEGLTIVQVLKILEKKLLEKNYDLDEILRDFINKERNEH